MLLAFVCVGMLIYFVEHIAGRINVAGVNGAFTIDGAGGYTGISDSGDTVTLGDTGDTVVNASGLTNIGVTGADYTASLGTGVNGSFGVTTKQ